MSDHPNHVDPDAVKLAFNLLALSGVVAMMVVQECGCTSLYSLRKDLDPEAQQRIDELRLITMDKEA